MSEELKQESTELIILPIEDQISQELVKANVTEAVIASLRERYMPLSIEKAEDKKEAYLLVKEGRKECKSIRIMASKICKKGREAAVKIQKAWIKTEDEVTGRISEIEDYLEKQEVEYEAEVAKEKEARKRKQEEQLIIRQQTLTNMGALYADGNFTLGEVSYEYSLVKESEQDIWEDVILPKFKEAYEKAQAEQIEKDRQKEQDEAEFKRQQEELQQKQKELTEKEDALKKAQEEHEKKRQEEELQKAAQERERVEKLWRGRLSELSPIGWNGQEAFAKYDESVIVATYDQLIALSEDEFISIMSQHQTNVAAETLKKQEEERKEQERIDLQSHRLNELLPYNKYGEGVDMATLWALTEGSYLVILSQKKDAFEKAQEAERQRIADDAAKKERERIEEEQRQVDVKTRQELRNRRKDALLQYNYVFTALEGDLADLTDTQWFNLVTEAKGNYDEIIRKQEEERKAEELLQASEKVKWQSMMDYLNGMVIHPMRGSLYRKKVAILKEKLEEIKAL